MSLSDSEINFLKEKALKLRKDVIQVAFWAGGGHVGGALSQMDILVALYFKYLRFDPKNKDWPDRDRVILSKGHGGVGYAPVLSEAGFFDFNDLRTFNHTNSAFGMHLDRLKVKGVDASTGSLGHGLGIAVGLGLGARLNNAKWLTYCIMGDGEQCEGSIWEAAMAGAHYKTTNVIAFIDRNKYMIDGLTEDVMAIEPIKDKWEAFGWKTLVIDGHDFKQIGEAIEEAQQAKEKPYVIIANTIKGKGVDFMEDKAQWHYGGVNTELLEKAYASIDKMYKK